MKNEANRPTTEFVRQAIPFGRENAISRKTLAARLGMRDRDARRAIEQARADGVFVLNLQDGQGYYQSTDISELRAQCLQDVARINAIKERLDPLIDYLTALGVSV